MFQRQERPSLAQSPSREHVSSRQIAHHHQLQHTYSQLLYEYQHPEESPHTEPVHDSSCQEPQITSWYDYVDEVGYVVDQHETAHIREEIQAHTERMRQEHEHTQETVSRVLAHTEHATTGGSSESDLEDTQKRPAILPKRPQRSHASTFTGYSIRAILDTAVDLYLQEFHVLPTHLRLSSYNRLIFCLECPGETPTAHVNEYGSFPLIPDAQLDDTVIVCEEYA